MKTWSVLPFAVFGILLAAFLLFSDCNGAPTNDQFGGPYKFRASENMKKRDAFECYKNMRLSLSKVTELNTSLFEESIRENFASPYGVSKQKYNYAILGDKIIVAEWNVEDLAQALEVAKVKAQPSVVPTANAQEDTEENNCEGSKCVGDVGDIDFVPNKPQKMINWFPETTDNPQSPCWLNRSDKDRLGLLDAISKHLMLAQGKGKIIDNFVVQKWGSEKNGDWKRAEVAYAGEIIVDVDNCTYSLNNDSGTYQRNGKPPDVGELAEVATHFAKEIDVGPNLYFDVILDPKTKDKTSVRYQTDGLFETTTKISNAAPRCP